METLKGSQRKYLRGLAHQLRPVAHVGKLGLTDAVVAAVDQALEDHELIKVKYSDFKDEKRELNAELERRASCHCVGCVGHVASFYRQH